MFLRGYPASRPPDSREGSMPNISRNAALKCAALRQWGVQAVTRGGPVGFAARQPGQALDQLGLAVQVEADYDADPALVAWFVGD